MSDTTDVKNHDVKEAFGNGDGNGGSGTAGKVMAVVWLVLLLVALYFAAHETTGDKVLHFFFALTAPPLYLVAVLLNHFSA